MSKVEVVCPTCGSGDWDYLVNDEAVCVNGHRWTQTVEVNDVSQAKGGEDE